jgi:hypothetical protein
VTEETSDRPTILLRTAASLLAPLARLLVKNGVTYTMFAQAMKRVFLSAAERELRDEGKRITDSALSLLSGVHRKDVRALTSAEAPLRQAVTIASQVTMAWSTQPEYLDAEGTPLPLPMRATEPDAPSFERLAQGVSKDFHARSVLDELIRLGVAEERDGVSRLVRGGGFIPARDLEELARQLAANAGDHLAASAANFVAADKGQSPPFLEFALWADELSAASVAELQQLAKAQWLPAMKTVRNSAEALSAKDRHLVAAADQHRIRFGVYVYHERGFEPLAGEPYGGDDTGATTAATTKAGKDE